MNSTLRALALVLAISGGIGVALLLAAKRTEPQQVHQVQPQTTGRSSSAVPVIDSSPKKASVTAKQVNTANTQPVTDEDTFADQRLQSLGLTKDEIAELHRRAELEETADSRFHDTVNADGLTAESVNKNVRQLFRTIKLAPEFNVANGQEGYIDGMRIEELTAENPFALAGLKQGDHILSVDGLALQDPAQIAHLLAGLGNQFEVCATRKEERFCTYVVLSTP